MNPLCLSVLLAFCLCLPGVGAFGAAGNKLLQIDPDAEGQSAFQSFHVTLDSRALTLEASLPGEGEGMGASVALTHSVRDPRHIFLPHLAPEPGFVIGDHAFRSPAIILSNDRAALALIPDINDVSAIQKSGLSVWMDYDHPASRIRVTVGGYKVDGPHLSFQSTPVKYAGQSVRLRLHVLQSSRQVDLDNPYGMAARWLWDKLGRPLHNQGGSQRAPIAKYSEYINHWTFTPEPDGWGNTVWQSFAINGRKVGAPAFIVDVAQHPSVPMDERRWREPKSVWNQAWFSTQRCANGLLRYARQTGSADIDRKARLMTEFALSAPQSDGLFPSVYSAGGPWYAFYKDTADWDKGQWINSDRLPRGVSLGGLPYTRRVVHSQASA